MNLQDGGNEDTVRSQENSNPNQTTKKRSRVRRTQVLTTGRPQQALQDSEGKLLLIQIAMLHKLPIKPTGRAEASSDRTVSGKTARKGQETEYRAPETEQGRESPEIMKTLPNRLAWQAWGLFQKYRVPAPTYCLTFIPKARR